MQGNFFEIKQGRLIGRSSPPSGKGSVWVSPKGKYMHGPRLRQPGTFKKLYILPVNRFKGAPKGAVKAVGGPLKRGGTAAQSWLRPVPKWVRRAQIKHIRTSKRGIRFPAGRRSYSAAPIRKTKFDISGLSHTLKPLETRVEEGEVRKGIELPSRRYNIVPAQDLSLIDYIRSGGKAEDYLRAKHTYTKQGEY